MQFSANLRNAIRSFLSKVAAVFQRWTQARIERYLQMVRRYRETSPVGDSLNKVDTTKLDEFVAQLRHLRQQNSSEISAPQAIAFSLRLLSTQLRYGHEINEMEETFAWQGLFDAMFFPKKQPG